GSQVRQVRSQFAQSERDFGDVAAGEPNAFVRDLEEYAYAVVLLLDAPARVILLDRECVGFLEVAPVAEKHRLDLFGNRSPWVFVRPEMVSEGQDVRVFRGSPLRWSFDAVFRAQGLKFC